MTFLEASQVTEGNQSESFIRTWRENISSGSLIAQISKNILIDVMQFRRTSDPHTMCDSATCEQCQNPHLSKIMAAVSKNQPVTFVLPAFPGKSPNLAKVLGPLPDMAERCALEFLQTLCDRIQHYHSPGARIILCSDGRVFSDVVGMRDDDVTNYQNEISKMIETLGLTSISTFNLEELYGHLSFDEMRMQLMHEFGESLDLLKESVSRGKHAHASVDDIESHRLYLGITRFLFEDALAPGQTQSRTRLQKESRVRAYSVIQRSKAWGELVGKQFADSVRLSIHPQTCGSKKLGIRMIEPDNWQTPWHGVAVQVDGRYILMKRSEAESLGARLVTRFGRASHYVLKNKGDLQKLHGVNNEA